MSQPGDSSNKNRTLRSLNLTLAAVTGQVGCLTILIIFVALFAGRWLDNQFDSSPLFTIALMVGSVPVTLVIMFWVVRSVTARFASRSEQKPKDIQEDPESGTTP